MSTLQTRWHYIQESDTNGSGRRRISLLDIGSDGLANELLTSFGVLELEAGLVERVLSGEPHPDEIADARRTLVTVLHRVMNPVKQGPVPSVLVDKADPKPRGHATDCSRQRHKSTTSNRRPISLHRATRQESAKSYNRAGEVRVRKRSSSILGNTPGMSRVIARDGRASRIKGLAACRQRKPTVIEITERPAVPTQNKTRMEVAA